MLKAPQLGRLKHSVLLPPRLQASQKKSLTWEFPLPQCPAALTLSQRQDSVAMLQRSL